MPEEKKQPKVLLFTTPTCGYCSKAKRYLKANGIRFREVDISRDPDAARDVQRMSGGTAVPVIRVGSQVVVGFDQSKLQRLLGLKKRESESSGEDPPGN